MKSTLKQISEPSSGQNLYRAFASEIGESVNMFPNAPSFISPQNQTHLQKSTIQRKPGNNDELPGQCIHLGNKNNTVQAFRIALDNNTFKDPTKTPLIQTKLSINAPGDQYEQEADTMADKVMRMKLPSTAYQNFSNVITHVQRQCAACEEEKQVDRNENAPGEIHHSVGGELDHYVGSLGSSGQTLSESSRQFFEPRFAQDFS